MNEKRISSIQQARTITELDRATDGYREQMISAHPIFRTHYGINKDLIDREYFLALADVRVAAFGRGDRYEDVIHVLEAIVEKKLAITTL